MPSLLLARFAQAVSFYEKYGFLAFPGDPNHLALPLETVEEVFGGMA